MSEDRQITINQAVLGQTHLDEFIAASETIHELLGKTASSIIPDNINSRPQIEFVLELSSLLSQLKECVGFDRHIELYKSNVSSAVFTARLACHLLAQVNKLELEPTVNNTSADIRIQLASDSTYIECKCPTIESQDTYENDHRYIFERVRDSIIDGRQVNITFFSKPTEDELTELSSKIRERLPLATTRGTIVTSENMTVELPGGINRDTAGAWRAEFKLTQYDQIDLNTLPGTGYAEGGKFVFVFGPEPSAHTLIESRLRDAKKQGPSSGEPFVLAVAIHNVLGRLSDHKNSLHRLFQPSKYTRFTGVLLVNTRIKHKAVTYVANPYAATPLPDAFAGVFSQKSDA